MGANQEDGVTEAAAPAVLDNTTSTCECGSAATATTPVAEVPPAGTAEDSSQLTLTKTDALEVSAQAAWTAYSKALDGKAFNGDPLPTWEQLVADPAKKAIVNGWREAANAAVTAFCKSTTVDEKQP